MCMCVTKLRVKDGVRESDVLFAGFLPWKKTGHLYCCLYFSAPWACLASRGPALARKESLLNVK